MTLFSEEFEEAVKKELLRLLSESRKDRLESEEFHDVLDSLMQKELDKMAPFFCYKGRHDSGTLKLYLSPPESDAVRQIDLEDILSDELDMYDPEHIEFILERLSAMSDKIKNKLSNE